MTGNELRLARIKLGDLWGLERALYAAELGRVLSMCPSDPGASILRYEAARSTPVPGPVATAVQMMLAGTLPPGGVVAIRAKAA